MWFKTNVTKCADIKVCKDKGDFEYTIWILEEDDFFQESRLSKSDKRQVPKMGNYANYLDRIDCRDLDDLMNKLSEYFKQTNPN